MSRKSQRNRNRSYSLRTLRKIYSDGWDLREHLQRRARQAILGENAGQGKLCLNEYNMEIQNSERRKPECALFESQRELESQRRQFLKANQWTDQAQRDRIHPCSELEMKDHLFQECYARSCREIIENTMQSTGKYWKNNEEWKNFLRSMIRNHEQWVHSSTILIYWAVMTYLLSSSSSYYFEFKSLAVKLECREIRERIWVFLETFVIVNMPNEILMNYTMIQEIWRYHWRFWEQKELRNVGAKNHCNQYLYLAFQ